MKSRKWENEEDEFLEKNHDKYTSEELAKKIDELTLNVSTINFIIGGSNGYNDEVRNIADMRISFSKMTFPHQLMRLILVEQIYRSICINNNISYHK